MSHAEGNIAIEGAGLRIRCKGENPIAANSKNITNVISAILHDKMSSRASSIEDGKEVGM